MVENVVSKISVEEDSGEENNFCVYRKRNDRFEELISEFEDTPPILNTSSLNKLSSKDDLIKKILKSDKHISTIIDHYHMSREFIFQLLKNYGLFDLSKEESDILLRTFFSNDLVSNIPVNDSVLELTDDFIISEPETTDDEDEDSDEEEDEEMSAPQSEEEEAEAEADEHPSFLNKSVLEVPEEKPREQIKDYPTKHLSTIDSIQTMSSAQFARKNDFMYTEINKKKEQIAKVTSLKDSISEMLRQSLDKSSPISQKVTIMNFIKKKDFPITFEASFFDVCDENGDLIFDQKTLDIWCDAIERIENASTQAFDCSQLIIMGSLYGLEYLANFFGIKELTSLRSEIDNPNGFGHHLDGTKKRITNIINNHMPNNPLVDFMMFIGNVYMKNKVFK